MIGGYAICNYYYNDNGIIGTELGLGGDNNLNNNDNNNNGNDNDNGGNDDGNNNLLLRRRLTAASATNHVDSNNGKSCIYNIIYMMLYGIDTVVNFNCACVCVGGGEGAVDGWIRF